MANKKINQLVLKTTIQSTDLFPLGDPTTGQLFKKTVAELQAAIGGAVISVNGLVGTVVLDTDDIQELATPTNRYFTEARARAAISLTTTGNSGASTYSNSTGVLNVPTYTLAGLGGITASFLSGGTGITYNSTTGVISYSGTVYTDASIRALVSAGTGLSYNSSTGVFSYSGTVYTDSSIRALISLTTNGSSGASTYNNTTGVLNVPTYTLAGLGGISLTSLSGSAPITYNSSTGAIGITQATGSTNGFLSSTDWTTFNSKQNALTLGNVTESVSNVLMFPDGGTNKTIGNLSIQVVQAGSTTNGFLSTTDWTTFNNKQNAITLTTTGTSGAATLSSGTLNIPQYQAVLTNPVTGTGTTNYVTKWTSSSAIGNSSIFDNGTHIGIGTTSPNFTTSYGRALSILAGTGYAGVEIFGASSTGGGQLDFGGSTTRFAAISGEYESSTNGYLNFRTLRSGTITNAMRITSAGNVGIGTTSPVGAASDDLVTQIYNSAGGGSASRAMIRLTNSFSGSTWGNGSWLSIDSGLDLYVANSEAANIYLQTSGATRMTIEPNGKTTISHSHPNMLNLNSSLTNGGYLTFSRSGTENGYVGSAAQITSGGTNVDIAMSGYTNLTFATGAALLERVRITSGGNILMGTSTDNGERLYVSGSIRATGSITANSDARLKKNIERIENALEKVGQISGYTYNTIYDEDRHAGVIAQEIDKVLPEIVNKGNDGLMGVEYGNISALLIEAIKDLKKDNESLRAIVEGLRK